MFLIEYKEGLFVDAEDISVINLNYDKVKVAFWLKSAVESSYFVEPSHYENFFYHLQTFDTNHANLKMRFDQIKAKQGGVNESRDI